jgi:hypothetical protein
MLPKLSEEEEPTGTPGSLTAVLAIANSKTQIV